MADVFKIGVPVRCGQAKGCTAPSAKRLRREPNVFCTAHKHSNTGVSGFKESDTLRFERTALDAAAKQNTRLALLLRMNSTEACSF